MSPEFIWLICSCDNTENILIELPIQHTQCTVAFCVFSFFVTGISLKINGYTEFNQSQLFPFHFWKNLVHDFANHFTENLIT